MKIGEQFIDGEGDTFYVKNTYTAQPVLERVAEMKSHGHIGMGESRHVGSIPMHIYTQWAKEAGVPWGGEEHREIVKKKMLSGEFSKLRLWEGNY